MSFRLKTILGVGVIEAVMLLLLAWSSLSFLSAANETALADRIQSTISLAVSTTKDAVLSSDLAYLESYVQELLGNPGVVYARVRDDRRVLAEAGDAVLLARPFRADASLSLVQDDVFDARGAVAETGVEYGFVEIGLSVTKIRETFGRARAQIALIAVLEMVLVAVFSFALGTYLTRQLQVLSNASRKIAESGPGFQVTVTGSDELARTSQAFNLMSARLKQSYDSLRDAYQGIVSNVSEGIITLDAEGCVLDMNAAAVDIFDLSAEAYPGRHVSEWVPAPFDVDAWKTDAREFVGRRSDGTKLDLDVSVSHLSVGDGGEVLACIVRDISERKAAERKIIEYAHRLEAQNKELQDFAYVASHDLQEPLRKVRTYGDILQEECADALPDDGRRYVSRMISSAERMQVLINDLLAYSRVDTVKRPFESVNLNQIVAQVFSALEVAVAESGAKVHVGLLPEINADPTQMRQLFQNLIGNAIKFRRPGVESEIQISACEAIAAGSGPHTLALARPGYRVRVRDNGIGFSPSYGQRIFEVFERLHPRDDYPGTGIGLAICRKIVARHGGSIRADSMEEKGATFDVLLPVDPVSEQDGDDDC
jgi:PAS domain S-box-containing protein